MIQFRLWDLQEYFDDVRVELTPVNRVEPQAADADGLRVVAPEVSDQAILPEHLSIGTPKNAPNNEHLNLFQAAASLVAAHIAI